MIYCKARGVLLLAAAAFVSAIPQAVRAADLQEPITIASENGLLNLLMIAKGGPIHTLANGAPGGKAPTGWVYEICKRPLDKTDACPVAAGAEPNYYGGTLLALEKGDTLKIHFINQLPPVFDSEHAQEPGHEFLALNPTNLHTHGMLVSPSSPTPTNPTYGDNIFVLTFNSANGAPVISPHMHSAVRMDFTDYEIKIPVDHPSGLFWFHPHAHGIALNQVTAGLSGDITVGNPNDYVCRNRTCAAFLSNVRMRHMLLKDTQILSNGTLQDEEDPGFCQQHTGPGEPSRNGSCSGDPDASPDFDGGKWFFTINGMSHPNIPVTAPGGEIWRITNASGSNTYDLKLIDQKANRNMLFQVISLDGVSVSANPGMSQQHMVELGGRKFVPETCPVSTLVQLLEEPLCTRELHLMPSARAEVWVVYRDAHDIPAVPPAGASAVFKDVGYSTGPDADNWPAIDLATVQFKPQSRIAIPTTLYVNGEAAGMVNFKAIAHDLAAENSAIKPEKSCPALAPGHTRRIFYGVPTTNLDGFGLAYEELDAKGNVVGAPATDLIPFDPMYPTVCVPLGPNNTPVTERWQLVNVATEDHNFHIHQTKFHVISKDQLGNTSVPVNLEIMMDNVPLPHADGTCGVNPPDDISNPISDWRAGLCHAHPITVDIPFSVAGDFVYHCHILEHEDGGMMARIRVRPNK